MFQFPGLAGETLQKAAIAALFLLAALQFFSGGGYGVADGRFRAQEKAPLPTWVTNNVAGESKSSLMAQ